MNQGDLEIRPARAEDVTAITECMAAAYRHYISRLGKPPGPMLDDYKEVIQQHRVLVLTDGAKISGVLVLIKQSQSLLVDNVAVHPAYQGRGLGRHLLALPVHRELLVAVGPSHFSLPPGLGTWGTD